MEQIRKPLDMDPSFVEAHLYLGCVYEQKGIFPEAIAEFRQALSGSGGGPRYVSALGHAYAISGQRRMAEESLARLREQAKQRHVAPYDIAEIHIELEDTRLDRTVAVKISAERFTERFEREARAVAAMNESSQYLHAA